MPRPTKLTPEKQDEIVKALLGGSYFDAACEYVGIAASTGYRWMQRGRDELARRENPRVREGTEQWEREDKYVEFCNAVSRASAEVEVRVLSSIRTAGHGSPARFDDKGNEIMSAIQGDWRALTWFMERRYPQKWGKVYSNQEHTGKDGGAIIIKTGMNLDDL